MYALLLAGGGGTRLWPLSTVPNPKQFIRLRGEEFSLFQHTVKRCLEFTDEAHILVLTGRGYVEQIKEQLAELYALYATLVKKGTLTIDEVPEASREKVQALVDAEATA